MKSLPCLVNKSLGKQNRPGLKLISFENISLFFFFFLRTEGFSIIFSFTQTASQNDQSGFRNGEPSFFLKRLQTTDPSYNSTYLSQDWQSWIGDKISELQWGIVWTLELQMATARISRKKTMYVLTSTVRNALFIWDHIICNRWVLPTGWLVLHAAKSKPARKSPW